MLSDVSKYLMGKRNPRAKFLLNLPDFVYQERSINTENNKNGGKKPQPSRCADGEEFPPLNSSLRAILSFF